VSAIEELVAELAKLPGIGRKTAQRLTFHLLKQPPEAAARLARAIGEARERVRACGTCGNLTDADPCAICADPRRDAAVLCVVEESADVGRSSVPAVCGRYHVLGGRPRRWRGGSQALRVDELLGRVREGGCGGHRRDQSVDGG
jgi:recombination protein RecR